ncbi:8129_t:CDS:2 [Entrophospora sp. SA101]|nr:8129_t:CDS:2 [Entrophospora sp. SA101]
MDEQYNLIANDDIIEDNLIAIEDDNINTEFKLSELLKSSIDDNMINLDNWSNINVE